MINYKCLQKPQLDAQHLHNDSTHIEMAGRNIWVNHSETLAGAVKKTLLAGGFNPSVKFESVVITIPKIWKIRNAPNHQPGSVIHVCCLNLPD